MVEVGIWEALKHVSYLIILPLLTIFAGVIRWLWKAMDTRQTGIENEQIKSQVRQAVMESQIHDTKSDIKDIKKSIEDLTHTLKNDMRLLRSDIKELIDNGKSR